MICTCLLLTESSIRIMNREILLDELDTDDNNPVKRRPAGFLGANFKKNFQALENSQPVLKLGLLLRLKQRKSRS